MKQQKKEETSLFYIGWSLIVLAALVLLVYHFRPFPFMQTMLPCMVHSIFGLYCPGCGGTRAITFLLEGQIVDSFLCHPLVLYTAVIGGWFMFSQSVERVSRHKIKIAMRYKDIYLWLALIIVIANFVVKNALLIFWQIDLLKDMKI